MSESPSPSPAPLPRPASRRRRLGVLLAVLGVLGVGAWFGGRAAWAQYHRRTGEDAAGRYDFPAALASFESSLRLWPRSAATHALAARAARRAGQFERAEHHLRQCEQHGGAPELVLESALLRVQQGNVTDVGPALLERVKADDPDSDLILEALAQGYFQAGEYGWLHQVLQRLENRTPRHPATSYWRARFYQETDRVGEALPGYRRAVELAPHSTAYRLRLAEALVEGGEHREAWPHLTELSQRLPASAEVRLAKARCLRAFTQQDRAIELVDEVLRVQPDNAEAWAEHGLACRDGGDHGRALASLRRAVELAPANYKIGFSLYAVLQDQGHAEEAGRLWDRLEGIRRDQNRVRELQEEVSKNGPRAGPLHEAGVRFLRLRNETEALRCFKLALVYDPSHRPTHEALAAYYQSKGNAEAAAEHRARAGGSR
jgi:tetratricopeptide (TPR) repeat protein